MISLFLILILGNSQEIGSKNDLGLNLRSAIYYVIQEKIFSSQNFGTPSIK